MYNRAGTAMLDEGEIEEVTLFLDISPRNEKEVEVIERSWRNVICPRRPSIIPGRSL